jgi:hypothetical protein
MIKAPTPYLNETLPDTTRRDALRKNVNRIYLDSWCKQQFTFSAVENDSLNDYAYGNPYALGDAVFTARVLLGLDPDKVPLPENTEAEETEHSERILTLYPNPTSGMVCCSGINNNSLDDQLTYQIFDIYGKLVHSGKCLQDKGEYCFALSTSLSEGIYFVRVWTKSKGSITGKLIFKH